MLEITLRESLNEFVNKKNIKDQGQNLTRKVDNSKEDQCKCLYH